MLAGKESFVDYEAGLWWERFKVLAGKLHREFVECFLLCVLMSMSTEINRGCSLKKAV